MDTIKETKETNVEIISMLSSLWEEKKCSLLDSMDKTKNIDKETIEIMKELLKGSKIKSRMKDYMESTLDEQEE